MIESYMGHDRKKIIAVCLCVLLVTVLFLSACKKNEESGQAKEQNEEEAHETWDSDIMDDNADNKAEVSEGQDGQAISEDNQIGVQALDIAAPSACGKLSVKGTQLVDEKGAAVQLRGISTHGLAWYPQYVNEQLVAELRKDWKANVLRLAMYTAESGGYCTDGDKESLKELIKKGVEYATNQDMYVIVDWHILSDGSPGQYKDEALAFFTEMSKEFADHNNVLYEICNEPNGETSWEDIKAYANEVIPAIRANAPDAVILIGTPNWSQNVNEAAAAPITEYSNVMYTLHFYAATHTGFLRNTMAEAIDAGLPVFVSEFGICDASGNGETDEVQAKAWVQLMNQYKVSYVAWNLSNKEETSAVILSSVDKTAGFSEDDLSDSGKWLYHVLAGSTGSLTGDNGISTADSTGNLTGDNGIGAADTSGAASENEGMVSDSDMAVGNDGIVSGSGMTVSHNGFEITMVQDGSWESDGKHFCKYTMTLKNVSGKVCESWGTNVKFNGNISLSDGWNGKYSAQEDTLHITSVDHNGKIDAGAAVGDVGFIVSGEEGIKVLGVTND